MKREYIAFFAPRNKNATKNNCTFKVFEAYNLKVAKEYAKDHAKTVNKRLDSVQEI
jgi:hypothetical protein